MATSKETTPKKTPAKKAASGSPRKKPAAKESMHEKIAKKAYELYEKSGRIDGRDIEHWLEAENLLKKKKK